MKFRWVVLLAVGIVVAGVLVSSVFAQDSADSDGHRLLEAVYENMKKNISYEVISTMVFPDGKNETSRTKIFVKDEKNIRTETETPETGRVITVMSPAGNWNYVEKTKIITEIPVVQSITPQVPEENDFEIMERREGNLKVVEVISKKDRTRTVNYIDPEKQVIVKTEIFGADGKMMMTSEYRNFVRGEPDSKLFEKPGDGQNSPSVISNSPVAPKTGENN